MRFWRSLGATASATSGNHRAKFWAERGSGATLLYRSASMSNLVVGSTLKEFFRMLVGEVVSRQRVSLAEVTEFYVVNLLSEFAAAEKLFTATDGGKMGTEPLAILYHRAMQQDRDQRIKTLRQLGDVSLYTAGFFSDSLR